MEDECRNIECIVWKKLVTIEFRAVDIAMLQFRFDHWPWSYDPEWDVPKETLNKPRTFGRSNVGAA